MKEYTFFSTLAVAAAFILDEILGTKTMRRGTFWAFMLLMISAEMVVNSYLTARPVFLYGESFVSGIKIGTIPLEDFIYGFAFISFVIILWEFFRGRDTKRRSST